MSWDPRISRGTKIKVLVITGILSLNELVAQKTAKWLKRPSIFLSPILRGLKPDSSITLIDQKHIYETALNILYLQVPNLSHTIDTTSNACILVALPLASASNLENLIKVVGHSTIDRLVIVDCMLPPYKEEKFKLSSMGQFKHLGLPTVRSKDRDHFILNFGGFNRILKLEMHVSTDMPIQILPLTEESWRGDGRAAPFSFFEAVECLLYTHNLDKECPLSISMRQWGRLRRSLQPSPSSKLGEKSVWCFKGTDYHDFVLYDSSSSSTSTSTIQSEQVRCERCEMLIIDPTYYSCKSCPLYSHKSCAELRGTCFFKPSENLPRLYFKDRQYILHCKSCKESGKELGSHQCRACVFETFLKR